MNAELLRCNWPMRATPELSSSGVSVIDVRMAPLALPDGTRPYDSRLREGTPAMLPYEVRSLLRVELENGTGCLMTANFIAAALRSPPTLCVKRCTQWNSLVSTIDCCSVPIK